MKKITCSFIKDKKLLGFTLAEVLITLTIIGVVAALTIPSLLASVNEKTYEAKRQGLATRFAQALSQIDAINAYEDSNNAEDDSTTNFIVNALSKSYKISNACEFENMAACDFPTIFGRIATTGSWNALDYANFSKLNGVSKNYLRHNYKGAAIRTKNGESMLLWYNPGCTAEQPLDTNNHKFYMNEICLNIWFDLDGSKKGPNMLGRDLGWMTVLYSDTPFLVKPLVMVLEPNNSFYLPSYSTSTASNATAENSCAILVREGRNEGEWFLPSREELYSWSLNIALHGPANAANYMWSSSIEGAGPDDYGWMVKPTTLETKYAQRKEKGYVNCVIYN